MRNSAKVAAGVALISLGLPTLVLALSTGPANASDITATVETVGTCSWELSAPEEFSLVPIDNNAQPLPAGTNKYFGEQMLLGGIEPLTLAMTGRYSVDGVTGESVDCSAYNNVRFPVVTATLDPDEPETFTATYVDSNGVTQTDTSLRVQLMSGNPLTASLYSPGLVALARATPSTLAAAIAGLTSNDFQCLYSRLGSAKSIMRGHDPDHADSNKMILWATNVNGTYDLVSESRCEISTLVMFSIPEATGTPDAAGREFTLAGPVLIYTLSTVDAAPATPSSPSPLYDYEEFTANEILPFLPPRPPR